MFSLTFACLKSRKNKAGECPIQLWININGNRAATILEIKAEPNQFKKAMRKANADSPLRLYCNSVRERVTNFYTDSYRNGIIPTPKQIVEYIKCGFQTRQTMLYDMFSEFLRIEQSKIGNDIDQTTYNKYRLVVERFKQAVADKPLNQVCHTDILDYKYYLLNTVKLGNGTLCGYLTKAKTIFNYAIDNDMIDRNPFRKLRIRKEEVEIMPLTKEELLRIKDKDFGIARLNQVRDCFLFAANTAMAYADLASICRGDIKQQGDVYYIQKHRIKTGVQYTVPLNDTALGILQRYNYTLPILTNQKYNAYLKEIADLCGIKKKLTSHIARHTAATMMINSGISIDVVAKILGHRNTQMTAHYAKMLDKTIILTKIDF